MTGDSGSFSRARRRTGANPNRTSAPRKNQHPSRGSTTRHGTPPLAFLNNQQPSAGFAGFQKFLYQEAA